MLVSVTERTREDRHPESQGATQRHILTQFLIEADGATDKESREFPPTP